jgi:transcription-repair coupling factor (superfamily II helicase)
VEFFGDEIDSIRRVDLDTQRSTEQIASFDLTSSAALKDEGGAITSLLSYLPADAIICMVEPTQMEETARQIDDAMFNITESGSDPFAPLFKEEETAKIFRLKREQEKDDVDEPTSPRPKFDFNNLKFGTNYSGD